jgi:PhnB protein
MQINPYLYFNGNCEEAFKFYEKALGGQIHAMMTHDHSCTDDDWRSGSDGFRCASGTL